MTTRMGQDGAAGVAAPRPCPLCEAHRQAVPLFRQGGFTVVRCASCAMVYIGETLSYGQQATEHEWSESFDRRRSERNRRHPVVRIVARWVLASPFRPARPQRILNQVRRVCRSGRLVDIGCGDGQLLRAAAGQFEVTGVDISASLAELAQRSTPGARVIASPITEADLGEGVYDVAAMISFLEHEQYPRQALAAAWKALKPSGWLVIKVPNYASWLRIIQGRAWCGYRIPDHCIYFTGVTLDRMLREEGFEPQPAALRDRLPTSDNLWRFARKH